MPALVSPGKIAVDSLEIELVNPQKEIVDIHGKVGFSVVFGQQAVVCDERDFKTSMTIVGCLINHTARVYAVLARKSDNPFDECYSKLTATERAVFDALPYGEITAATIIAVAARHNTPKRSAERMISRFCNVYRIITPCGKRGFYHKVENNKIPTKKTEQK